MIELDGETYRFSRDRLDPISGIKDIQADMSLVSDMQEAISRTITIESPAKYTEIMARKRLQESGEFDEPISVIAHWKKRKGKNLTPLCRFYHWHREKDLLRQPMRYIR